MRIHYSDHTPNMCPLSRSPEGVFRRWVIHETIHSRVQDKMSLWNGKYIYIHIAGEQLDVTMEWRIYIHIAGEQLAREVGKTVVVN